MKQHRQPFPIVGIGASAGGVEALQHFFEGVPDAPGCGFVIVTHVNPERKSYLDEVVGHFTQLPVVVATDGTEILIDHVYVAPAGAMLGVTDGRLTVVHQGSGPNERRPIDVFFGSLAIDQTQNAVGVVLSGANADGALGIKAIKERGGLTMAQIADGHPPSYPEMPNRAILTGMVDLALPVTDMGEHLTHFAQMLRHPEAQAMNVGAVRDDIFEMLRSQVGYDFSTYKPKSVDRRIERRIQALKLDRVDDYVARLKADPVEVAALFRDLLIRVTSFFRDADAFEALGRLVVPKMLKDRSAVDAVRVWAPGCSTGEEAYSLAILLHEATRGMQGAPQIQVFATDIDEGALAIARTGVYPQERLEGVSAERRRNYFTHEVGCSKVVRSIRDMCVFSIHSVLKDPPFSQIDLISCRNLLIYFGSAAQDDVIPIFRYALRPGGHLFLGASENVSRFKNLFASIDKKNRLFEARDEVTLPMRVSVSAPRRGFSKGQQIIYPRPSAHTLKSIVETFVLETLAAPYVVVTGDGDIVLYSARTGKYFETPAGLPSQQLLAMARRGLRLPLRSLLTQVKESGMAAVHDSVEVVMDDGRFQPLSLSATPLPSFGDATYYMIVFNDRGGPVGADVGGTSITGVDPAIERELRDMHERLQAMIEEYETALEELKSSNEELLSVNEEFQSANEELESSKEEMQSVNEELQTVNCELGEKLDALGRANGDLRHMLENSLIATVFLDACFNIRMFTPSMKQFFSVIQTDIGRPLTDLATTLAYADMPADLKQVRETGQPCEKTVPGRSGLPDHRIRIASSFDERGSVDGVIMTIVGDLLYSNIP